MVRGKYLVAQPLLFEPTRDNREFWRGMPEFNNRDLSAWRQILVSFRNDEDVSAFGERIGQKITPNVRALWYPQAEIGRYADKVYISNAELNPRFPIYVISKGRWDSRPTSKALERCNIPYRIVVEPQEYDKYAALIDPYKILELPFSNLGQGSIPARNWVWEHSISEGYARHWILDDNIDGFFRFNNNLKVPVATGATFRAIEDFVDRYGNIAQAGMNYFKFVKRKSGSNSPILWNTRIYSCILNLNSLSHRWRGRYNEDTDLSLRLLKDGYVTALFNAFLADKRTTMLMRGGNTAELYAGEDARYQMAKSLEDQHPDCVTIARKFNRWQHQVDYSRFKRNKPIPVPNGDVPDDVNEFGMVLSRATEVIPAAEFQGELWTR